MTSKDLDIPDYIEERADVWRLVADARISASLHEIETSWSIEDVWDAIVYLEILDDAETLAIERARERERAS